MQTEMEKKLNVNNRKRKRTEKSYKTKIKKTKIFDSADTEIDEVKPTSDGDEIFRAHDCAGVDESPEQPADSVPEKENPDELFDVQNSVVDSYNRIINGYKNSCQKNQGSKGTVSPYIGSYEDMPDSATADGCPNVCIICNESFQDLGLLKEHFKCHGSVNKENYCNICNKSFKQAHLFTKHKCTKSGEKPYLCQICNTSFGDLNNLKRHLLKHTGERPHKCEICEKTFSMKGDLKRHSQIHSEEAKIYICDECGKGFYRPEHLKRHVSTLHLGEKNHACPLCGKAFALPENMKKHVRLHMGYRPHTCDLCGKTFTTSHNLKVHIQRHKKRDEKQTYECKTCRDTFTSLEAMEQHMVLHYDTAFYQCGLCGRNFKRPRDIAEHCCYDLEQKKKLLIENNTPKETSGVNISGLIEELGEKNASTNVTPLGSGQVNGNTMGTNFSKNNSESNAYLPSQVTGTPMGNDLQTAVKEKSFDLSGSIPDELDDSNTYEYQYTLDSFHSDDMDSSENNAMDGDETSLNHFRSESNNINQSDHVKEDNGTIDGCAGGNMVMAHSGELEEASSVCNLPESEKQVQEESKNMDHSEVASDTAIDKNTNLEGFLLTDVNGSKTEVGLVGERSHFITEEETDESRSTSSHEQNPDYSQKINELLNLNTKSTDLQCTSSAIQAQVNLFVCRICSKSFPQLHSLERHIQRHKAGRKFLCPICSKPFSNGGNLRSHLIVHTGEKNFVCEICNSAYSQKTSLNFHKKKHKKENMNITVKRETVDVGEQ